MSHGMSISDVPLNVMVTIPVYDADGLFLFYHGALRTSDIGNIIVRGQTEQEALDKLKSAYSDWLYEPSR